MILSLNLVESKIPFVNWGGGGGGGGREAITIVKHVRYLVRIWGELQYFDNKIFHQARASASQIVSAWRLTRYLQQQAFFAKTISKFEYGCIVLLSSTMSIMPKINMIQFVHRNFESIYLRIRISMTDLGLIVLWNYKYKQFSIQKSKKFWNAACPVIHIRYHIFSKIGLFEESKGRWLWGRMFITDRIQRMGKGNVFSLFTPGVYPGLAWGRFPHAGPDGGTSR